MEEEEIVQDDIVEDDNYNPFDQEAEEVVQSWDPFEDAHKIDELQEKREQ